MVRIIDHRIHVNDIYQNHMFATTLDAVNHLQLLVLLQSINGRIMGTNLSSVVFAIGTPVSLVSFNRILTHILFRGFAESSNLSKHVRFVPLIVTYVGY